MAVKYTYPSIATLEFSTSAPGVNYLGMPEDSDGFIDKVVEAFGRGKSQALAGVAITAAIDNPNLDLDEALRVRTKLQRNEQLNPLEGNWLSDVVYSSSRAAGQMFESVKKAGVGAVIGGAAGAIVGGLLPSVGEEVPLTALGAKFGAAVQAALFSFRSGRGEMYADMLDQGVSHDTAKLASGVAGIPYALIEVAQLKALAPALKAGASQVAKASALRFVKQAAKTYGTTLTTEVMEEIGQEGIQIVAEDVAKYLDGQGVPIDSEYFKDRAERIWATAKEATKGFALLPIPGTAIEVGLQYHGAVALQEIEQAEQNANKKQIIDPADVESPIGKVQIAIDNSVNTWDAQEQIRRREKGIRIAEAKKYTGVALPMVEEEKVKPTTFGLKPNLYRTVSGSRTGITEQEVVRKGERYVHKATGEDVILETAGAGPGAVDKLGRTLKQRREQQKKYTLIDSKEISELSKSEKQDLIGLKPGQTKLTIYRGVGDIEGAEFEHGDFVTPNKKLAKLLHGPNVLEKKDVDIKDLRYYTKGTRAFVELIYAPQSTFAAKAGPGAEVFYHGTSIENAEKIRTEGFKFSKKQNEISISKEKSVAEFHAKKVGKRPGQVGPIKKGTILSVRLRSDAKIFSTKDVTPEMRSRYLDQTILDTYARSHGFDGIDLAQLEKDGVIKAFLGKEGEIKIFHPEVLITQPAPVPTAETKAAPQRARQQSLDWKIRTKMALKGAYTKLGIQPLQEIIPVENYAIMHQELGVTDKLDRFEALNLDDALEKLFKEGALPRPFERKLFGKMWGPGIEQSLNTLAEIVEDKGPDIMDYFNLPRATASAGDLSRTARQNVLMIGEPKLWFKALVRDWHLLIKDDETARTLENDMQLRLAKAGDLLTKTGIRWNKYGEKAGYKTGSERFASKIAGKIPGITRSERAYSVGGNLLRGEKILQIAEQRAGFVTTDKMWKDIGHVVNLLTGEGDAKLFGRLAPVLNAFFFAPRLAEARVRAITDIFNPNLSWAARKILAWDVAKTIGINIGILGAMSLVPGVEVETDYRSTDFGKIKYGNTRVDFWGGYLPIARLAMRLYAGKVKTQSGRIIDVDARDTIISFLQSKLGPVPAYLLDLARGETFYGDYVGVTGQSLAEQFYHRFIPFVAQDIIDAIRYQGWKTGVVGGALAFHGVGVQTYPMSKGSEVLMRKNALAMEVLGRKWDETGPDIQAYLRESFPQIEIMERQAIYDRSNFGFLEKIAKEREATVERMTKKMPSDVREEFALLNLKIGGIGRTISTDWFLNESRAKDYEQQVTKAYQEILPKIIRLSYWNRVLPQTKVEILTEVMNEIKKGIRDQIIAKANINDFQQIKRGNE